MGQGDTAGRGRKPRLARAELRSMLLDAALEILREEGLQTGSVNITFKRVCDRVQVGTGLQVTNGSVIKLRPGTTWVDVVPAGQPVVPAP